MAPSSSPHPVRLRVFEDSRALADHVADRIVRLLYSRRRENRPLVLGLAAGASPRGVYAALARRRREDGLSFSDCITFALDEYHPMDMGSGQSFFEELKTVLDALDIPEAHRHHLRGDVALPEAEDHCRAYEEAIRRANGIDFQLLGVGRNGHIAFNEPGAGAGTRTRRVELQEQTRRDAVKTFGSIDQVPTGALTMGVGTILEAREIALIAEGAHKAAIIKRIAEQAPGPTLPASFVKTHSRAEILLDEAAASMLPTKPRGGGDRPRPARS